MSVELMLSRAVLEDGFSPVLRRIAGNQDAFARKTAALNMTGNVLIGAGAGLVGFAVKSAKVAGEIDGIRKAMAAVEGQQKATFDLDYVDKFAQHSKYTYLDLAHAGERLALAGVPVKAYLSDVADLAAKSHKPLAQVAKLYDTVLAGHNVSLALSARGGFSQFYISPDKIFAAAGKQYVPGKTKLQGSMTPEEVVQAVHKVLVQTGASGLNEKLARTTMEGAEGMISDAVTRLSLNVVSGKNLTDTIQLLDTVADDINKIADAAAKIPNLGEKIVGAGAGAIAVGALLKGAGAYRELRNMMNLAKIAGDAERAGEKAKGPIADAEGAAVNGVAVKYSGLQKMLMKVGSASLGVTEGTYTAATAMGAGTLAVGLYAVALAGIVAVGAEVVTMFTDMNDASRKFEASIAAVNAAKAQGYDLKAGAGQAQGFSALPVWKQVLSGFGHSGWGAAINPALAAYGASLPDADTMGTSAISDKASTALARKHGRPHNGVTATMLREQKAQRDAQAAARREAAKEAAAAKAAAAGAAANGFELDPAMAFKLKQDERRVALLKEMGGHEKELKAARAGEIADLNTAAALLERQAAAASDVKAKYDLMDQAAENRQKAKLMGLEKSDQRDKLDKHIASILGGGGLGEDEILKRAGIGRSFFAGLGKGKPPQSPLKMALTALAKRPLILNLHLGDKTFAQVKSEILDDTLQALLHALEGSNPRALYGGS